MVKSVDKKHRELKRMTASSVSLMTGALFFTVLFSSFKPEPLTILANAETPDKVVSQGTIESEMPVSGEAAGSASAITENASLPAVIENINKDVIMADQDSEKRNPVTEAAVNVEINNTESAFDPSVLSEVYLKIKRPEGAGMAVVTDDYLYRTVSIDIDNANVKTISSNDITRYYNGHEYTGDPEQILLEPYIQAYLSGNDVINDDIQDEYYDASGEQKKKKTKDPLLATRIIAGEDGRLKVSFVLNTVYVPTLYEDNDSYYISLKRPKEVYDKIVVIDAGHGGKDPGSFSFDGKTSEKSVNLKIVNYMKDFFDKQDTVKVYYTRTTDTTTYLKSRTDLANKVDADYLISVHNNAYFTNEVYGSEILYDEKDKSGKSKALAADMLQGVTDVLKSRYRGLNEGSKIYVIHHTRMPSVLMEVGYLTNDKDLALLKNENKLKDCAEAMYNAIMRAVNGN